MYKIKQICKKLINKFAPFISRHVFLKKTILLSLSLFPKTKEKILNYKRRIECSIDNQCFLEYGFGKFEKGGIWSINSSCKIILFPPIPIEDHINIEIIGNFFQKNYVGNIFVNSEKVAEWKFYNNWALKLPTKLYPYGKSIEIIVNIPDIKSPFELGLSEDRRTLGIFLKSVKINGAMQTLLSGSGFTEKAQDIYSKLLRKIDAKRGSNAYNS